MTSSDRRTAAAAAAAADVPTELGMAKQRARTARREHRAAAEARNLPANIADQRTAGMAVSYSDRERIAAADGAAAGALMLQRDRAAAILATNAALGYTARAWFLMPEDLDPETGEPLDARDVIAAVSARGRHRYAPQSPLMAADDLLRIAANDAARAARMTDGRMDPDDMRQAVALRLLDRFTHVRAEHPGPRPYPAGWFPQPLRAAAAAQAVNRDMRYLRPVEPLPRWDAIDRVDWEAERLPEPDLSSRRRAWRAFAAKLAFDYVVDDRRIAGQNVAADWTDSGDDAPTAEQVAAAAAERAAAAVWGDGLSLADGGTVGAVERIDQDTLNGYASAAPGSRMGSDERAALAMALANVSRDQLAAARGVGREAAKKSAQRGRKSLRKRIGLPPVAPETPAEARAAAATVSDWVRAGRGRGLDPLDRWTAKRAALLRLARVDLDPMRHLLPWPDRSADPLNDGWPADGSPAFPPAVSRDHPGRGIAPTPAPLPSYGLLSTATGHVRIGATSVLPTERDRIASRAWSARMARLAGCRRAAPLNGSPLPQPPRAAAWMPAHNTAHRAKLAAAMDTAERTIRATETDARRLAARIPSARLAAATAAMNPQPSASLAAFIARMEGRTATN